MSPDPRVLVAQLGDVDEIVAHYTRLDHQGVNNKFAEYLLESYNQRSLQHTRTFQRGLFVARIDFYAKQLHKSDVFHLEIQAFNGTDHNIQLRSITGYIGIAFENREKGLIRLPRPEFSGLAATQVDAFLEFYFTLEQHLMPSVAQRMKGWEDGQTVTLDFGKLDFSVQSVADARKAARLPLWDAMTLTRRGGTIQAGRQCHLRPSRRLLPFRDLRMG